MLWRHEYYSKHGCLPPCYIAKLSQNAFLRLQGETNDPHKYNDRKESVSV